MLNICTLLQEKKDAYMIFRVSDTKKSESILTAKGLKSLTQEELSEV